MPRRTSTQPDAQWLTERAQRASSRTGDRALSSNQHLLAGTSVPDEEAADEAIRHRRAPRYILRKAHDDPDRDLLIDALELSYEAAAPVPVAAPVAPAQPDPDQDAPTPTLTRVGRAPGRVQGDWAENGACRDAGPDLFYPPGWGPDARTQVTEAKKICHVCPVKRQCLRWAIDNREPHGIWGGTTEPERRLVRAELAARAAAAAADAPEEPADDRVEVAAA